jgi:hypothetical protein
MTVMCPGQNTQFWKPDDIFQITCPACGSPVEFFKDDAKRRCPGCGCVFVNPKLNEGCAKWCKFADKCLGVNPELHESGVTGAQPKRLKAGFVSGVRFGVE